MRFFVEYEALVGHVIAVKSKIKEFYEVFVVLCLTKDTLTRVLIRDTVRFRGRSKGGSKCWEKGGMG